MLRFSLLPCLVLAALAAVAPAHAAGPEVIGKFGFWTAYKMHEGGQPVCYMSIASQAPVVKGSKTKRGEVMLMITHRPAENSTDVVSYTAGAKFKPASEVTMTVGKKVFSLFTQNDTAWSHDASTDHALATAIRRSSNLTAIGLTAQGTKIGDAIDLKGAAEAYRAIGKACSLPIPEEPASPKAKKPAKKSASKPKKS